MVDAPRAGSAEAKKYCTLCLKSAIRDAPRAGSAEAKAYVAEKMREDGGCTPCRQRRGKVGTQETLYFTSADAPRAGSAEAKPFAFWLPLFLADAPRAGSAEAKPDSALSDGISA